MAHYRYSALNQDGGRERGRLEAADAQAAAQILHKRNWLVLELRASATSSFTTRAERPAMSVTALARFTQQLATLLGAGQDLQRALGAVLKQTTDVRHRALVETLRQQVKAGRPFSSVLEEQGRQFPTLYTALVRAGEAGGTLQETLSQLTDYLERSEKLRGEVINALIYPAFLIVGVLGSLILLLTYVVPQFVPIFRDLNVPLPLITEVILALGQGLAAHALALGAAVPLLAAAVTLSLRDPQRRVRIDARLLRGKVLGGLLQRIEVARFTRTLGTLLSNGVGLLQALVITQQVCGNRALRSQLASVTEAVKGGSTLVNGFGSAPLVPDLALQMIEVGEQAGQLDAMLLKVADIFDVEAKRSIDRMLAALVPTLTIVMAALVAVIMLAIMLPLMSLTSNI